MSEENSRRLFLRVAVKLMFGFAVLSMLWVLLTAREYEPPARAEAFALPELAPGEVHKMVWRGRRILILGRDPELIDEVLASKTLAPALADPDDRLELRLAAPGLLVMLDYGGELGCPLEWRDRQAAGAPQPWFGGLYEGCRHSWYDPLGRIYAASPWGVNLKPPAHRIEGNTLLLGGE